MVVVADASVAAATEDMSGSRSSSFKLFSQQMHSMAELNVARQTLNGMMADPTLQKEAAIQYMRLSSVAFGALKSLTRSDGNDSASDGQQEENRWKRSTEDDDDVPRLREVVVLLLNNFVVAVVAWVSREVENETSEENCEGGLESSTSSSGTARGAPSHSVVEKEITRWLRCAREALRWCEDHTTLTREDEMHDSRDASFGMWWTLPTVQSRVRSTQEEEEKDSTIQNRNTMDGSYAHLTNETAKKENESVDVETSHVFSLLKALDEESTQFVCRVRMSRAFHGKLYRLKGRLLLLIAKWTLYHASLSLLLRCTTLLPDATEASDGERDSEHQQQLMDAKGSIDAAFLSAVDAQSALRVASNHFHVDCDSLATETAEFVQNFGISECALERGRRHSSQIEEQRRVGQEQTSEDVREVVEEEEEQDEKQNHDGEKRNETVSKHRRSADTSFIHPFLELSSLTQRVRNGVGWINCSSELICPGTVLLRESSLTSFPGPSSSSSSPADNAALRWIENLVCSARGALQKEESFSSLSSCKLLLRMLSIPSKPPNAAVEANSPHNVHTNSRDSTQPCSSLLRLFSIPSSTNNFPEFSISRQAESKEVARHHFFYLLSRLNHDCCPNAILLFTKKNSILSDSQVVALRSIAPGEEVTIAYDPQHILCSRAFKQKRLQFTCVCRSCNGPARALLEGVQCMECRRLIVPSIPRETHADPMNPPREQLHPALQRRSSLHDSNSSCGLSEFGGHASSCPNVKTAPEAFSERATAEILTALNEAHVTWSAPVAANDTNTPHVDRPQRTTPLVLLERLLNADERCDMDGAVPRTHYLRLQLRLEACALFAVVMLAPSLEEKPSSESELQLDVAAAIRKREKHLKALARIQSIATQLVEDLTQEFDSPITPLVSAGNVGRRNLVCGGAIPMAARMELLQRVGVSNSSSSSSANSASSSERLMRNRMGTAPPADKSTSSSSTLTLVPARWPLITGLRMFCVFVAVISGSALSPLMEECSPASHTNGTNGTQGGQDTSHHHHEHAHDHHHNSRPGKCSEDACADCCGAARHEEKVLSRPFVRLGAIREGVIRCFQDHFTLFYADFGGGKHMTGAEREGLAACAAAAMQTFLLRFKTELKLCGVVSTEDLEFLSLLDESRASAEKYENSK